MSFYKYIILSCTFFFSCNDLAKQFVEESIKEGNKRDSLKEEYLEYPISKEHFEILERKQVEEDSLFLIRNFFTSKERYSDSWYKNNERHGVSKFYYRSGGLNHSFIYKEGFPTDLLENLFPDGTKRSDSYLKKGTGHLKIYHPITLKLSFACNFVNGYKNGKFSSWYANGNEHEDYTFVNDSLVGDYTVRHRSGKIQSQRRISNNEITYSYFYESGKPERLEIWKNDQFSVSKSFDEDGNITEEGQLVNGQLKSVKSFYGSKKLLLSRGNYLDQKKQGGYEYYYEDGAKKAIEYYDKDTLLSEKRWYENGNLSLDAKYYKGEYNGLYIEYYPNGKKRKEQTYLKGVKQGKYTSYFDNGNKYNEGNFVNGKPKGKVKVFNREGKFVGNKEY